jgi:glycosyltransferase involved in cell wall biosynthesis
MKKTKICILQNGLARGGTDTFVLNLCRGIDKERFELTVVNPSSKPDSRVLEPEVLATGATIVHTSDLGRGAMSKLRHFVRLYKLLRRERFDVFHTNIDLFNGPNLLVAWLAGVPVRCCHSHNGMQQKALVEGMTLPIRIYQSVMRWMCWHFSNRRTGCSKIAMEFLFVGRPWRQKEYPSVIYNGIDLNTYRTPIDVDKKMAELGLTAKHHIVTVGRIIPQKNPLFIAESFAALCRTRTDCDLVWVGVGELEQQCREIFERNGVADRVHFLGSRGDVAEILQCCDLFYLPSNFEGLGIVVIEAQASGLRCLVSDAVPFEADCGGCKFVSLKADMSQWISIMSDMLDGKIVLKIDESKMQRFSIEYMVKQMEQVFTVSKIIK